MRTAILLALTLLSLRANDELSNRRAPGFSLPDAWYEHYYDLADYRGKVVLVDIMQTNCAHCQLFTTALEDLKKKYGDRIAVLPVVLPPDNQKTVSQYIKTHQVTMPILCDMGQMTASYFKAKPNQGHIDVPHLFLIDKQGTIRHDYSYDEGNKQIFEGTGLVPLVDELLK